MTIGNHRTRPAETTINMNGHRPYRRERERCYVINQKRNHQKRKLANDGWRKRVSGINPSKTCCATVVLIFCTFFLGNHFPFVSRLATVCPPLPHHFCLITRLINSKMSSQVTNGKKEPTDESGNTSSLKCPLGLTTENQSKVNLIESFFESARNDPANNLLPPEEQDNYVVCSMDNYNKLKKVMVDHMSQTFLAMQIYKNDAKLLEDAFVSGPGSGFKRSKQPVVVDIEPSPTVENIGQVKRRATDTPSSNARQTKKTVNRVQAESERKAVTIGEYTCERFVEEGISLDADQNDPTDSWAIQT